MNEKSKNPNENDVLDTEFEVVEEEKNPIEKAIEYFEQKKIEAPDNYEDEDDTELAYELENLDGYIEKLKSGKLEDLEYLLEFPIHSNLESLKSGRVFDSRKEKKQTDILIEKNRVLQDTLLSQLKEQRLPTEEITDDQPIIDYLDNLGLRDEDKSLMADFQSGTLDGLESVYKILNTEIVYNRDEGDDASSEKSKEHLRNLRDAVGDRILEFRRQEREQGEKSMWQKFKESVVAKKLKGEYVSPEEMSTASKLETAALATGKVVDIASSIFGVRLLTRLPDRVLNRHFTNKEIKSFETILKQQEKSEEGAEIGTEVGPDEQVTRKIEAIKEKIATSKHLTPEKRLALEQKLAEIQSGYEEQSESNSEDLMKEIGTAIREHVGERTKNVDLLKDSMNLVGVATGMYAFRAAGMGATMVYERFQKIKEGKKEGEKVKIFKELIYQGAKETAQEMIGQGKLKDIKGWRKIPGVMSAWGKPLVAFAIAKAGASEFADKGAGAFSLGLQRFQERGEEISQAWDKFSQAGGTNKVGEAINLIRDTFNMQETWNRMTFKSLRGAEDGRDIAVEQKEFPLDQNESAEQVPEVGDTTIVPEAAEQSEITPAQAEIIAKEALTKVLDEEINTPDATQVAIDVSPDEKSRLAQDYLDNLKIEEKWELDKLNEAEKDFGIDSTEVVSDEELNALAEKLPTEEGEKAEAVLDGLKDKEVITPEQHFEANHASLKNAGFNTETVESEVEVPYAATEQTNINIELGKDGAPQHLEQVFYRMAIDNMDVPEKVTNLEGARMLNVGANLRELSEGHNIAGVTAEEFAKYASVDGNNFSVNDYASFKEDVLDKLTAHSEKIITPENLPKVGATAYLDNFKLADMFKPTGIEESDINFDQEMIDAAEKDVFGKLLENSDMGDLATDIEAVNENTGSLIIDGQSVDIKNGSIISIGGSSLENPIGLGGGGAKEKLLEQTKILNAKELLSEEDKLLARLKGIDTGQKIKVPESVLEVKYDTSEAMQSTLKKLGFGKGQGKDEWKFLEKKSVDDLLNKKIEGHSGRADWLEGRHRGKLREFFQKAINNGKLIPPKAGGPATIKEAMDHLMVQQTRAELHRDIDVASKIFEAKEGVSDAAAPAETPNSDGVNTIGDQLREGEEVVSDETVIEGSSEPTKVNISASSEPTVGEEIEAEPYAHLSASPRVEAMLNDQNVSYDEKINALKDAIDDNQIVRFGTKHGEDWDILRKGDKFYFAHNAEQAIETKTALEVNELTPEVLDKYKIIDGPMNESSVQSSSQISKPEGDIPSEAELTEKIYQSSAAEAHFAAVSKGSEITEEVIGKLEQSELSKLLNEIKTQIKGLQDARPLVLDEEQVKIDSVIAGYQEKLKVIESNLSGDYSKSTSSLLSDVFQADPTTPEWTEAANKYFETAQQRLINIQDSWQNGEFENQQSFLDKISEVKQELTGNNNLSQKELQDWQEFYNKYGDKIGKSFNEVSGPTDFYGDAKTKLGSEYDRWVSDMINKRN